jgi:hypothetical protein
VSIFGDECSRPICERLDVLVDGNVGSNKPAVCECLRKWPDRLVNVGVEGEAVGGRVKGEGPFRGRTSLGECAPATERAADMAVDKVGREKFCRLVALALLCEVKLV